MKKRRVIALISISFLVGFLVCFALKWPQSPLVMTIEGSLPILCLLEDGLWSKLPYQTKALVVRTIYQVESHHLGFVSSEDTELAPEFLDKTGSEVLKSVLFQIRRKHLISLTPAPIAPSFVEAASSNYATTRSKQYWGYIGDYLFKLEKTRLNIN